ncbi:MAG: PKD domain-containing protein [Thermoplasmatota archaeon]
MKRTVIVSLLLMIILVTPTIPLAVDGGTSSAVSPEEPDPIHYTDERTEHGSEPFLDVNDLADSGVGDLRTIALDDPDNITASVHNLDWLKERSSNAVKDISLAEESDTFDEPFFAEDGDEITNNVTSTISGTSITFDDEDYYQINLTSDGPNTTVEKLELTVTSTEAEEKNASLTVEVFHINFLLQQWMDAGFASVGKYHGNTTKFVYVPEGDRTVNFVYPIMFRFRSWNSTMLNFTFDVEITQTTRSEWNGLFGGGPQYNSTNKPANMQSINRSHDYCDWFDLSGTIADEGLDTERGDNVEYSLRVEVATEERGRMYNPYGLYGQSSPTTSIMFVFLAWYNYTSQELNIYNIEGSLPYASVLFGRDPVSLGFESQADHVWLGMSPLALWGDPNGQYSQGAEGNAEMFYNITRINAKVIPPNGPPRLDAEIDDQVFYEDEGPWLNITDLNDHFSDPEPEHDAKLRFEVIVVDADSELRLSISDDGMLSVEALEDNYNGWGEYKIKCYDWGPDWVYNNADDLSVVSNVFEITVLPVNDDAYIAKVDVQAGSVKNEHEPIHITIPQGFTGLKSKKIYAYDNDTDDVLEYSHNATTPSFTINVNGQYNFLPTNDDVGVHWIKVTVDDGHAPSEDDYCILVFHVTNRNDAPSLVSIEWRETAIVYDDLGSGTTPTFRNVQEDLEVNFTLEAYDPDIDIGISDSLQWMVGGSGWEVHPHSFDPMKAYLTYTPTNDDAIAGMVTTSLQVMDSQNAQSDKIDLEIYVENVNDDPRILSVNNEFPEDGAVFLNVDNEQNGYEDRPYVLTVIAEDIDPRDDITFSVNDPSWQQSPVMGNEMARNFTIVPTQDMVGNHTLRITVRDENGGEDTVVVNYQIVNTNDPPNKPIIKYDSDQIMYTDRNLTFRVESQGDPDGDPLEFVWDFGDGTEKVRGEEVTHVYRAEKSFTITVYAVDPSGANSPDATTYISTIEEPEEIDPDKDSDGDGMPDIYEVENGLDKDDPNDRIQDPDKDGFSNYEEYLAGTDPLDPKSHPERDTTEEDGMDSWIWVLLIIGAVFILAALGFLLFVLMAKPKEVHKQQAYGAELPGTPPPQLQQEAPQQQQLPDSGSPGLPPAEEEKTEEPEEDLLEDFMEDAHQELERSSQGSEEEENVWKPPASEEASPEESQVEDLFDDEGEESGQDAPRMSEEEPKKSSGLPDLPPPPEI